MKGTAQGSPSPRKERSKEMACCQWDEIQPNEKKCTLCSVVWIELFTEPSPSSPPTPILLFAICQMIEDKASQVAQCSCRCQTVIMCHVTKVPLDKESNWKCGQRPQGPNIYIMQDIVHHIELISRKYVLWLLRYIIFKCL